MYTFRVRTITDVNIPRASVSGSEEIARIPCSPLPSSLLELGLFFMRNAPQPTYHLTRTPCMPFQRGLNRFYLQRGSTTILVCQTLLSVWVFYYFGPALWISLELCTDRPLESVGLFEYS
ncbi:hypothetical protein HNY73_009936 [Argiope bruennichi]|uniref:Uncharacterized protein n=1 Tax=Argiope bruennichi TaxID=94029 RepID=A0A8T0FB13_ARGBR|nr:hypothetical protein HNY73_009936 [Argiope bruennichi]